MIGHWTGWVNWGFLSSTWPKPALSASPIIKGYISRADTQIIVLCEHSATARPLMIPLSIPGSWMKFWGLARRWLLAAHKGAQLGSVGFFFWLRSAQLLPLLAGREDTCVPLWMKAAFTWGDAAAAAVPRAEARRKGRCSVPRVPGRILRKQQGRNKRHWLVGWPHCYSEPAWISKAGVNHSARHSNMVMLEMQEGEPRPC